MKKIYLIKAWETAMYTINELIEAYGQWVQQELQNSRMVYYANLMFEPLKGGPNAINVQMRSIIENIFYPALCKQLDRHSGRKGRHKYSPHLVLVPDLPIFKRHKTHTKGVTLNRGLHCNGFISISPRSRLKGGDLMEHFAQNSEQFTRLRFRTIHVEPITHDSHRVMDYSMKTIKRGEATFDDAIILPRTWEERQSEPIAKDPRSKAIKQIQSSTNISDDVAVHFFNHALSKRRRRES
jgi:hypothetical protein